MPKTIKEAKATGKTKGHRSLGSRNPGRDDKLRPIDWELVKKRLEAHCDIRGIAYELGLNRETLYRRCETDLGIPLMELAAECRVRGNNDLLNTMQDLAVKGQNAYMLNWLSKNRLGYAEKSEVKHKDTTEIVLIFGDKPPAAEDEAEGKQDSGGEAERD